MHLVRECFRSALLKAGKYDVQFEGQLPPSTPENRFFIAPYPHGEHANSFLFPLSSNIVYLAAHDHFYRNLLNYSLAYFVASTIPIVRRSTAEMFSGKKTTERRIEQAFHNSQKVAIYPQGTRSGPADSPEALAKVLEKNRGLASLSQHFQASVIPVGFVYPPEFQPRKHGPSGDQRIWQRLRGKEVPPITVGVKIGEPIEPLPQNARKKESQEYMHELAYMLWSMVHGDVR